MYCIMGATMHMTPVSAYAPEYYWAIPFFVHMDGVGFPAWFFFSFCIMDGSGKICSIIHTLVVFEQFIFSSCLDFFYIQCIL